MIIDCYKISDLKSKKHPQKKETLILTFPKRFRLFGELFMLKKGSCFFTDHV